VSYRTTLERIAQLKTRQEEAHKTHETPEENGFVGFVGASEGPSEDVEQDLGRKIRRAWSDALCRSLHQTVARTTPAGIGTWEGAWEMVEHPSKRLLEILARWEEGGRPEDKAAASEAAERVLGAWTRAGREWARLQRAER
jgi:hypothetical protein